LRYREAELSTRGTDSIVEFTKDDIAPCNDSNFDITDGTYRPEHGVQDTIKPVLLEVPKKLYHETEMVSPALKELARRERVQKTNDTLTRDVPCAKNVQGGSHKSINTTSINTHKSMSVPTDDWIDSKEFQLQAQQHLRNLDQKRRRAGYTRRHVF